jgi:dihydrolipoamide dehydrogenase
MNKLQIPGCTYCHPQVASVGLTERQGQGSGHKVKVGRFPFLGNGKAIALGEPDGLDQDHLRRRRASFWAHT